MTQLRKDANEIISATIAAALPDAAVKKALANASFGVGKLCLIAAGKAGWQMAKAACDVLGNRIDSGIVVTKYDHVMGQLPNITCCEAGHPVPDENSFAATAKAMEMVSNLTAEDTVLFLLSGGGSALFECPIIDGEELADITRQLLACGADIVEMNIVRKRLSRVKGGKFAQLCAPAKVFSIVLSDIIGDPLDMIASGPAYPDSSTCAQALEIVQKYNLTLSQQAMDCLAVETPKTLDNVETQITGSVTQLCLSAAEKCKDLGYIPTILTASMVCTARDAGSLLASIAQYNRPRGEKLAYIVGGETVVQLVGDGKGGRNQEIALAGAIGIAGMQDTAVFSVGSDGTDGPTDAAGGYCDGNTVAVLAEKGVSATASLANNDAYTALAQCDSLIMTGPTGTNVNDFAVLLLG